jgi:hypothetical protein
VPVSSYASSSGITPTVVESNIFAFKYLILGLIVKG